MHYYYNKWWSILLTVVYQVVVCILYLSCFIIFCHHHFFSPAQPARGLTLNFWKSRGHTLRVFLSPTRFYMPSNFVAHIGFSIDSHFSAFYARRLSSNVAKARFRVSARHFFAYYI